MNGDYYKKQTGVIMEHNTDNLFFIIPMVKVRWEYKGKSYDIERLDFTNVSEGSPVSIAVNTKAPNHCLLLDNSRLLWFNIIVGLLWLTTLGFLIRHIYLRRSQKVWIKYYPEFMKALSEVDILKGDMK